ncbi:MAG: DNA polymerase III subunit delta' [Gammaproteobacteria bacterium]|nr:MAG: DNA polymerase III subunit delta' [Gammaproteobacteria bacterium]RLA10898.1 MAG: DNA polymerase III subunit delta' [Gammaproteobacteria bacterium]
MQALHSSGQLPHALLLVGPPGIGKEEFLQAWVSMLVCSSPTAAGAACGQCSHCRQHASGSYPDCMVLSPEPDLRRVFESYPPQRCQVRERSRKTARTVITIDQIRELIDKLTQSSHYGGLKIVIIMPADALNKEAANALLKVLEEPPEDTLLLLLSERPLNLLATIRSRCQRIDFPAPPITEVIEWLGDEYSRDECERALIFTNGAPRHAQDLLTSGELQKWLQPIEQLTALAAGQGSLLQIAGDWEKHDRAWLTGIIQGWLRTLVGSYAGLREADEKVFGNNLRVQRDRLHLAGVFELTRLLDGYVATQGIPLNNRLMWEAFLLSWQSKCLKKKAQK